MKEGALAAYAIFGDDQAVLSHVDLSPGESFDVWLGALQDMVGRGLRSRFW